MRRGIPGKVLNSFLALLMLVSVLYLFSSCTIQEVEQENTDNSYGSLFVTAWDTTTGEEITGATIIVAELSPQTFITPDTIEDLPPGSYDVRVQPEGDYQAVLFRDTVEVVAQQVTEAKFYFASATNSENPAITIVSDPEMDSVYVLLFDDYYQNLLAPVELTLTPGSYPFSVFRRGYRTMPPSLVNLDVEQGSDYELTFTLQPAEFGNMPSYLAPDFDFPTDLGGNLSLGQFRGRLILVDFWFSDCEACRHEFPSINQVYEDRRGQGFRVLAVNTGWYESGADHPDFLSFRDELNLTVPLLMNTYGNDFTTQTYGFYAAPTNFLVDPSGMIVERFGATNYDLLLEMVDSYLE